MSDFLAIGAGWLDIQITTRTVVVSGLTQSTSIGKKVGKTDCVISSISAVESLSTKYVTGNASVTEITNITTVGKKLISDDVLVIGSSVVISLSRKVVTHIIEILNSSNVIISGYKISNDSTLIDNYSNIDTEVCKKITNSADVTANVTIVVIGYLQELTLGTSIINGSASVISNSYKRSVDLTYVIELSGVVSDGYKIVIDTPQGFTTITGVCITTGIGYKVSVVDSNILNTLVCGSLGYKKTTGNVDIVGLANVVSFGSADVFWPSTDTDINGNTDIINLGLKLGIGSIEVRGDPLIVALASKKVKGTSVVTSSPNVISRGYNAESAVLVLRIQLTHFEPLIKFTLFEPSIIFTHYQPEIRLEHLEPEMLLQEVI